MSIARKATAPAADNSLDINIVSTRNNEIKVEGGGTENIEVKAAATRGEQGPPGPTGPQGPQGESGVTPHIGDNGNWYIGEQDTGKPSQGRGIASVSTSLQTSLVSES